MCRVEWTSNKDVVLVLVKILTYADNFGMH